MKAVALRTDRSHFVSTLLPTEFPAKLLLVEIAFCDLFKGKAILSQLATSPQQNVFNTPPLCMHGACWVYGVPEDNQEGKHSLEALLLNALSSGFPPNEAIRY